MSHEHDECRQRGHRRIASLRAEIVGDLRAYRMRLDGVASPSFAQSLGALLTPAIMCAAIHRVAHFLHVRGWRRSARGVAGINRLLHKVNISPESCVGRGLFVPHPPGILFHGCAGSDLVLYSHATVSSVEPSSRGSLDRSPVLGDRVTVGAHAVVLGAVRVGDRANVMLQAIVTVDVPADHVVSSRGLRVDVRTPQRHDDGTA